MELRTLGRSGLRVSLVGLGCNNFGGRIDIEASRTVVHKALDSGITLFDTANVYGEGRSEEFLGEILGPKRKDVVLVTKFGMNKLGAQGADGSRCAMFQWVETSLKRLKTDYIDVYMLHRPDPLTPIEETLRAFDDLVRQGKVRYIAHSNFAAWQAAYAHGIAQAQGYTPFIAAENEYNLLARSAERELLPALTELGLGFLPFFPLASGLLTGKYRRGAPLPPNSRLSGNARFAAHTLTDSNWGLVDKLFAFAETRKHSLLEIAFAWLKAKPVVSSIIAGATKLEQVEANVKAGEVTLTAEEAAELDALTERAPAAGFTPGQPPRGR